MHVKIIVESLYIGLKRQELRDKPLLRKKVIIMPY
jgi:hypothetical protein